MGQVFGVVVLDVAQGDVRGLVEGGLGGLGGGEALAQRDQDGEGERVPVVVAENPTLGPLARPG